jgi:hypothetical protein
VLTISALDIFASALGVFMLVSILMFPFYLKQPALEAEREGAQAELAAAAAAVEQAQAEAAQAEAERTAAEGARAAAQARVERAEAALATAPAPDEAVAEPATRGDQQVRIAIADLDLVFVMDTTGSMRHELADLQASLVGIVRVLSRLATSLRIGFVAYKDRGEAYLTRVYPLQAMDDAHAADLVRFVQGLSAEGGGDDPEAVDEALDAALAMPWRADVRGRIIVVGDVAVHPHRYRATLDLAEQFRRSGSGAPRTVSAIFAGNSPADRAFFERLAAAGGGELSLHEGQMIESVLLSVLGHG